MRVDGAAGSAVSFRPCPASDAAAARRGSSCQRRPAAAAPRAASASMQNCRFRKSEPPPQMLTYNAQLAARDPGFKPHAATSSSAGAGRSLSAQALLRRGVARRDKCRCLQPNRSEIYFGSQC